MAAVDLEAAETHCVIDFSGKFFQNVGLHTLSSPECSANKLAHIVLSSRLYSYERKSNYYGVEGEGGLGGGKTVAQNLKIEN